MESQNTSSERLVMDTVAESNIDSSLHPTVVNDTQGVKTDQSSDSESTQSADLMFTCDCCECDISGDVGSKLYVCTQCDDMTYCSKCFSSKHHACSDHQDFLHDFEVHNLDNCFCNSCGIDFSPSNEFQLIRVCHRCEDYCVCNSCYDEGMHGHHRGSLKLETLYNYTNSLI